MIPAMKTESTLKKQLRMAIEIVAPYGRRYAGRIVAGCAALIVVDFIQLYIPRVIKRAVDDLQAGTATSAGLLRYAAVILVLALAVALLRYFWRYFLFGSHAFLRCTCAARCLPMP